MEDGRVCLLKKSPYDSRDWNYGDILKKSRAITTASPAPDVDYRPHMLPVRNQGHRGTCASFASSAMKEWQERKDVGLAAYMSPEFIYDSRCNAPTEGMFPRDVMDILSSRGVCFEAVYPYSTTEKVAADIPQVAKDVAIKYKIKSYAQVTSVDDLKLALLNNGPCLMACPCYNSSPTFWKPTKPGDAMLGGHATLIVGYTSNSFIVRNSWGEAWGDKGYTYFPFSDWGVQWEIWTTIDDASPKDTPLPPPPPKCACTVQ